MSEDFTAEYLNDVLGEIAADSTFLSFARGRRDEVLDAAEGVEGVVGRFVSGSIAHGTANGTTDADCGIELDPDSYENLGPDGDPPGPVLETIRSHIREVLRDEHPDIAFRITKRAITVTFNEPTADALDPTVDLIVGLTRDEGGLWIPNTERPGWDPSHPKKHTELLTGGPKNLRVLRARAIRLAKAWNNQFSQPGLSSFNLEALALVCVTADMSLAEALTAVFSHAATDLRKRLTPDPAGVSPAIKLLIDRDIVIKRLDKATAAMEDALENARAIRRRLRALCTECSGTSLTSRRRTLRRRTRPRRVGASQGLQSQVDLSAWLLLPREHVSRRPQGHTAMAGRNSRGKRSGGPWYGDERRVVLLERATRSIRGLRRATKCGSRNYNLIMEVEHYDKRRVSITFSAGSSRPKIMVDGPTDSPHRYEDGSLCIWYPWDSEEQRWTLHDGLLQLLGLISLHLFREAWWRETGEWLGPEAPHSTKAN